MADTINTIAIGVAMLIATNTGRLLQSIRYIGIRTGLAVLILLPT
jgi:hypothetical protein